MGKISDVWTNLGYWLFPSHRDMVNSACSEARGYRDQLAASKNLNDSLGDLLAEKTLELESLKKKIVERAQTPPILRAKSAAEIRRIVDQQNEREFEEMM
jgi:hypothetical protein